MVILITSSSSSKAEFTRIFYDVFDVGRLCRFFSVGGFTPLFVGIPPLPLLTITSLSLLNSELF